MDELEAMKAIKLALDSLEVGERQSTITWILAKYGEGHRTASKVVSSELDTPQVKHSPKAGKTGKKSKLALKILKDLKLDVHGKSAKEFVATKAPSNVLQKSVVAVYYLANEISLPVVTVDHVFTFFKYVGWPVPTDPINTLQQAGTKGWLDTKLSADIKITHMGENVVEHELPAKSKG